MFISKTDYERMQEDIAFWQAKYEEERKEAYKAWNKYYELYENRLKDFLKDYEYGVLYSKDDTYVKVWNQGRFEKGVKEVELRQEVGFVPFFVIQK